MISTELTQVPTQTNVIDRWYLPCRARRRPTASTTHCAAPIATKTRNQGDRSAQTYSRRGSAMAALAHRVK